jgi:hypothetical protein
MTAHIIPLRPRRHPTPPTGPVAAQVRNTDVYDGGPDGPLLAITLTLKLRDIPPAQRRLLNALLHDPQGVTLTLTEGRER